MNTSATDPPEVPGKEGIGPQALPAPTLTASTAIAAVQAERRRIAQALHDTVSQTLTGVYLQALVIARKLEASGSGSADDAARLTETIHRAVDELQEVTRGLQPDAKPPVD